MLEKTCSTNLCGFCLACARRPSRCTSEFQMKRSSEGKITAICQGGDDEPTCVSKVLIAVVKLRIYCSNNHIVFPVVPEWNDTLFFKWHEGQKKNKRETKTTARFHQQNTVHLSCNVLKSGWLLKLLKKPVSFVSLSLSNIVTSIITVSNNFSLWLSSSLRRLTSALWSNHSLVRQGLRQESTTFGSRLEFFKCQSQNGQSCIRTSSDAE